MVGRIVAGPNDLENPGDYTLPMKDYTGDLESVFFIKPNGSKGHISSPPHEFKIEEDGTLTVSPSISNLKSGDKAGETDDGWHGFLKHGEWTLP